MKSFETTTDMRRSIRAIANLPATLAANQAFRTFLEVRNNLEQPLDVNGIDELNERLLTIVESVIDDLELIPEAKDLAFNSAQRAVAIYQTQKNRGSLTVSQIGDLKAIVDRIVKNFNAM